MSRNELTSALKGVSQAAGSCWFQKSYQRSAHDMASPPAPDKLFSAPADIGQHGNSGQCVTLRSPAGSCRPCDPLCRPAADSHRRREQSSATNCCFATAYRDFFRGTDPEAASRSTLDTSMLMGLDVLCGNARLHQLHPRDAVEGLRHPAAAAQTVVEVLETVPPDDLVISACQRLKEKPAI